MDSDNLTANIKNVTTMITLGPTGCLVSESYFLTLRVPSLALLLIFLLKRYPFLESERDRILSLLQSEIHIVINLTQSGQNVAHIY